MEAKIEGKTVVLKRILDDLKNNVDEDNVESVSARMLQGESAVSKLIHAKIGYTEPVYSEDPIHYPDHYSDYIVRQVAMYCIEWRLEQPFGHDCQFFPGCLMDEFLHYFQNELDDELLLACWLENCHGANWLCQTEEYVDTSDGAKLREKKWLTCLDTQSRVTAKHAGETIAMTVYNIVEFHFHVFTKQLYREIMLQEWVTAYNTDTGVQNNPVEIERRIIEALIT